jgi:16S rRNA (guanine527-N7)-methyltransferase
MKIDNFVKQLEEIGIPLSDHQLRQLEQYYELLIEYNKVMNLTGITEKEAVYLKHFYDSATLNQIINLQDQQSLCDIGTGAGFPGLVLKILFPHLQVTLVDSLNKRIQFLNIVIHKLGLEKIDTYHARAEEFAHHHREEYDVVTARAVANLTTLLEYCVPLVKVGKYFIPMKANINDELIIAEGAMKKLAVTIVREINFELPIEQSHRCLLMFCKQAKTDRRYPRKFSEMKKKPLN